MRGSRHGEISRQAFFRMGNKRERREGLFTVQTKPTPSWVIGTRRGLVVSTLDRANRSGSKKDLCRSFSLDKGDPYYYTVSLRVGHNVLRLIQ